jgi:catechol 2,3-dioxygenase-like lactoylglutathione lyase family enzyme
MAQSLKSVNVITLFVEDQLRSKEFYEQIFDVVGVDEGHGTVIFQFDNLFLRGLRREEAEREMLAGARGARDLDRLRPGRSPLGRA